MDNSNKTPWWLMVTDLILLVLVISVFFLIYGNLHKPIESSKLLKPPVISAFDSVNILAKAAYIYDINSGKAIYQKNAFTPMPLASLTKLMTAETALALAPVDSRITIKKEFLEGQQGDSGLLPGEIWKMKDLLDFSLMVSSNGGVQSLASVIGAEILNEQNVDYNLGRKEFVSKMNEQAQTLGLDQSYFLNESGLDVTDSQSGGYGSAENVARLMAYLLSKHPDILETTKYVSSTIDSSYKTHIAKNTNIDISKTPGIIASKTGYTSLAGGNLAIAFDPGIARPIIVVVLGSTEAGRFSDIDTLVQATLDYLSKN